ncbi:MAG TPA: hypothetical protein VNI02_15200 [Blastocatellia bacterium]|nr:hypothetical protein [Blastocatellia bacterium]
MNVVKRALVLSVAALLLSLPLSASAQWDKKPYAEWSEKEAQKVLNDSPWARTQVFTSAVTLYRQPATGRQGASQTSSRPPDATHVNFRIRFLSAKPVRQAIGRMMELKQKRPVSDELAAQLKTFASGDFLEYIVITVSCDSQEAGGNFQQALSLLHTRGTADLKNSTFLEVKGGKRLFLQEYQAPRQDGLGARFIFPRMVNGEPFITTDSEEIHFYTELNDTYRLDRRYKVKDMMYEGKLEY